MEFSFEYYQWLQHINANPKSLFLLTTVGVLAVVLLLVLLQSWVKVLRIRFLSLFVENLIFVFVISGFLGLLIFGLLFALESSINEHTDLPQMFGIRLTLIWVVLFMTVFAFYVSNRKMLALIYNERKENLLIPKPKKDRSKRSAKKPSQKKKKAENLF